jgi:O-antigen ligase
MVRIFHCFLASCLGAGILVVPLYLDPLALQGFREPKIVLWIFLSGLLLGCLGLRLLASGLRRTHAPAPFPLPLLGLLPFPFLIAYHWHRAGVQPTDFLTSQLAEIPLPQAYQIHVLLPVLAWIVFFWAASVVSAGSLARRRLSLLVVTILAVQTGLVCLEIAQSETGLRLSPLSFLGPVQVEGSEVKKRIYGTIGNPNFLAGFLAICSLVTVGWTLGTRSLWGKVFGCFLLLASLGCIVATRSKGGLLALGVGTLHFLVVAWWTRPHKTPARAAYSRSLRPLPAAVVVLLLTFALLAGWFLADRSAGEVEGSYLGRWKESLELRGDSVTVRALLAVVGFSMWEDHPWVGWGPGGFKTHFLESLQTLLSADGNDYLRSRVSRLHSLRANHLHNEYLQVLVEWGIVGWASVLLFLAMCQASAVRLLREGASARDRWTRLGLLSGFWCGMGGSLFDLPFHRPAQAAFLAVVLGAAIGRNNLVRNGAVDSRGGFVKRGFSIALGVLLVVACIWVIPHAYEGHFAQRQAFWAKAALDGKIPGANTGKVEDAIRKAIRWIPGEGEYAFLLARFHYEIEKDPAATVAQIRRIRNISEDPNLYFLEARAQIDRNNFEAASPLLAFLERLDPEIPGLQALLARVHQHRGEWKQAVVSYLAEIERWQASGEPANPEIERCYLQVALLLEDPLGEYSEAARYYREFLDLQAGRGAGYPQAQLRLASLLRDRFFDLEGAEMFLRDAAEQLRKLGLHSEAAEAQRDLEEVRGRMNRSLWGGS